MKTIYLIRHGKSSLEGSDRERGLAEEGCKQAEQLAGVLEDLDSVIEKIYSSPFRRAVLSLQPYADRKGLTIHIEEDLRERHLSNEPIDDINKERKKMWSDLAYSLPGGETGMEAQKRGLEVLRKFAAEIGEEKAGVAVSHGNLIGLIVHAFDSGFGFNEWRNMTMPDIFRLKIFKEKVEVKHIGCKDVDTFKIG